MWFFQANELTNWASYYTQQHCIDAISILSVLHVIREHVLHLRKLFVVGVVSSKFSSFRTLLSISRTCIKPEVFLLIKAFKVVASTK
jgi:hypothetical protein